MWKYRPFFALPKKAKKENRTIIPTNLFPLTIYRLFVAFIAFQLILSFLALVVIYLILACYTIHISFLYLISIIDI